MHVPKPKIQSALHPHNTQIALWGLGAFEKEKVVAAKSRIIQDFQKPVWKDIKSVWVTRRERPLINGVPQIGA